MPDGEFLNSLRILGGLLSLFLPYLTAFVCLGVIGGVLFEYYILTYGDFCDAQAVRAALRNLAPSYDVQKIVKRSGCAFWFMLRCPCSESIDDVTGHSFTSRFSRSTADFRALGDSLLRPTVLGLASAVRQEEEVLDRSLPRQSSDHA